MGPLRELLAVDSRKTLEFFVLGLQDVAEAPVDRQELLYNASVLAHYAQVSTPSGETAASPSSQSVASTTASVGSSQANDRVTGSPNPSPSRSA